MKNITQTRRVGLLLKHNGQEVCRVADSLGGYLLDRFGTLAVREEDRALIPTARDGIVFVPNDEIAAHCDLMITIGGDGTLLKASHICAEHEIPIVGINLGRLGFLVEITPDEFRKQLDKIFAGEYRLEKRAMLEASLMRDDNRLGRYVACNEVALRNKNTVRMIELDTRVDGVFLNSIWSDGLIIATPTGSTGYALSSGGPLLEPTMEATLLVPICPHTLSHRPLVTDAGKVIEVTMPKAHETDAVMAIDGQLTRNLKPGDRVVIRPLQHKLMLIQPAGHNYFDTLRSKLKWSEKL